jgi:GNAT superfamily N-acetyltransferase
VAIRQAGERDIATLTTLRRLWAEEQAGQQLGDDSFEERLAQWYAAEAQRRVTFLAEIGGNAVGMVNLALFERMPKPGQRASRWGYLGNAFVLTAYRNRGIGAALLDALVGHAYDLGCARIVLSPSERSVPFYKRAGFGPATMLMARVLEGHRHDRGDHVR